MAIPQVFHFLFGLQEQRSPFHLMHYLCIRSCRVVNQPVEIRFHYLHEPFGPLWEAIKDEIVLCPLQQDLLDALPVSPNSDLLAYRYAHLSDFIRVTILQLEGGVYADMDTLFITPLPKKLFQIEGRYVMGHERVDYDAPAASLGSSLCNAFLMAEPGTAFGRLWQDQMAGAFDGSWSGHSTFLPFALSQQHPDLIQIEPEASFFYLDWTPDGIARLFERNEVLPEAVYSLHLWAHLWWSPTRRDVSDFHHGRLTANYIAHANTTYARYARPFLPAGLNTGSSLEWQVISAMHRVLDAIHKVTNRVRHLVSAARRGRP